MYVVCGWKLPNNFGCWAVLAILLFVSTFHVILNSCFTSKIVNQTLVYIVCSGYICKWWCCVENIPTNLQARYDLFCVKSAVKPQPTNQPDAVLYNLTCCIVRHCFFACHTYVAVGNNFCLFLVCDAATCHEKSPICCGSRQPMSS